MTVARELPETAVEETVALREWVRPAVHQLAAGSAEDSSGPAFDAATNPS